MWIESHQSLRDHPKTKRAARFLGICEAQMVGHLHFLWWKCLDYAEDGNLAGWGAADVADAAGWVGDPIQFVDALLTCNIRPDGAGFLETDDQGNLLIHDWYEFAGKLIDDKKRRAAHARDVRATQNKATVTSEVTSPSRDPHVTVTLPPTVPNLTVPNQPENMDGADAPAPTPISDVKELFAYYKAKVQPKAISFTPRILRGRITKFGMEACRLAVDHFSQDWWEMENNAHRGADWFFATDKRVEGYINMTPRPAPEPRANGRAAAPAAELPSAQEVTARWRK